MEKKIETKIVTAFMFSHSDNLNPSIKCHGSNTPSPPPPTPPLHITGTVDRVPKPNMQLSFFFVFCRWNLSATYPIKVHDLMGTSTHFPFLL